MKQSHIIATVIFLLILGGIIFFGFFTNSGSDTALDDRNPVTDNDPDARPEITITAKHQFKDGTHIIVGETDMPTPCHIFTHETLIAESFPEQVTINFDLSTQADTCTQVITPARFLVEFQASEEASIEATLNGERIILNLIEAGPDENLEEFELFIKG